MDLNILNETYRGYLLEAFQPNVAWRWSAFAETQGMPQPPPNANRRPYETADEALAAARQTLDALFAGACG